MNRFVALFTALDETNRTADKVAALVRYFTEVGRDAPDDAAWAAFLLSGRRLKRAVSGRILNDAAIDETGLPDWMIGECYEAVGDFSETLALLLSERGRGYAGTLTALFREHIEPLAAVSDREKLARLRAAWAVLSRPQMLVFHKLISGTFRFGVARLLLVRALAKVADVPTAEMAMRLSGGGAVEPTAAWWHALMTGDGLDLAARPYPFCLAHPVGDEGPVAAGIGTSADWLVEYKWDGIRCQMIRRAAAVLWSRGEEIVTGQFPELAAAASRLPPGTVLDGEVLMWRDEHPGPGRALPFSALQRRLNRKDVQPGLFDVERLIFLAFDLLESGGEDWRARPLEARRERMRDLAGPLARAGHPIILAEELPITAWEDAARLRASARTDRGAEGLMLKRRGSPYLIGRAHGRKAAAPRPDEDLPETDDELAADPERAPAPQQPGGSVWLKWKIEPFAVDAVLFYAQPGTGKRSGLFTDYTFAVWDGDELVPFAKAYSGLTDEEIAKVDRFVRQNTLNKMGPVRIVKPELVFEIGFEGIRASDRHRSGVAVRFPRMLRWRTDKPAAEADTIDTVRALLPHEERGAKPPTRGSRGRRSGPVK